MKIAEGTEDGIDYKVYLKAPFWVVEVTDGVSTLKDMWEWAFTPTCGPDVADVVKAEEVLERLIKAIKE